VVFDQYYLLDWLPEVWATGAAQNITIDVANGVISAEEGLKEFVVSSTASYVGGMVGGAAGSAVSGVIGEGIASAVVGGFVQGAVTSVVSQCINIALGMQDDFSWKAVAVGAVSGAAAGAIKLGINKAMAPKGTELK